MKPRKEAVIVVGLIVVGGTTAATIALRAPRVEALRLPGPHEVHRPRVARGCRLAARHHGAPHPVRAALTVGEVTWVGTASAGLLRYGPELWTTPSLARPRARVDVQRGLPSSRVNDLALDDSGQLLVATARGLARLDRGGRVRQVLLRGEAVHALAPGLAGTWHGLFAVRRHGPRGRTLHAVPVAGFRGAPVLHLRRCGEWVYVGATTLIAVHRSGWLEPVAIPPVTGMEGCPVTVATLQGLFNVRGAAAAPLPAWERHATVAAGLADGSVLFGTFGEGAFRFTPGRDRLARLLPRGRVSLVHVHRTGSLLVGTDEGLYVRDGQQVRRVPLDGPPPGMVTALAPRGDALWVGTFDSGLAVMTRRGWRRIKSPDDRITALQVGPRGRVWVGTATGLLRQSATDPTELSPVRDPEGWLGRHVSTLRRHGDRLWVGVYPGLVAVDVAVPPGEDLGFEHLGARGQEADRGLVGPTVYGAAFGENCLWAGTEDGLTLLAGPGQDSVSPARLGRLRGVASLLPSAPSAQVLTDLGGVLPDNWITDVRRAGSEVHVLTLRSGLLQLAPRGSRLLRFDLMTSPSGMLALRGAVAFGTNRRGLALVRSAERITTHGPEQGLASAAVAALAYDADADRLWIGGDAGVDEINNALQSVGAREERP